MPVFAKEQVLALAGNPPYHEKPHSAMRRVIARRLVRSGFTLVMPRWGGWTSDLSQAADLFARYYPERAGQMRAAATAGRVPSPDPAVIRMLIDDLGPWLAAEYTDVHGEKAPRPGPPA